MRMARRTAASHVDTVWRHLCLFLALLLCYTDWWSSIAPRGGHAMLWQAHSIDRKSKRSLRMRRGPTITRISIGQGSNRRPAVLY